MLSRVRIAAMSALVVAASLVIYAGAQPSQSTEIQLQLGNLLFEQGRYFDALEAYQKALELAPDNAHAQRLARAGVIRSALRTAAFDLARREAESLVKSDGKGAESMSLYADALWAAGLFDDAEQQYRDALAVEPDQSRGLHGLARALASRSRLDEALDQAQAALKVAPRDLELHHTLGLIYERMHRYEDAADAYGDYVNLLPNKDVSEKAAWSRAEIRFLRSFGQKQPFEMPRGTEDLVYTMDFRLVNEKVIVNGRINDGSVQDFVVDTGSENTVISVRTAQRMGIAPITYTLSAGVGEVGLRGLQLARLDQLQIGQLKLRNVPCIIKNPPLKDIPVREGESFSPLALGFSMVIDYKTHKLTIAKHLPQEPGDFNLPMRVYRLATVRGMLAGNHAANFVVDTGGEVISISQATASALGHVDSGNGRKIALKVYGTSGWDRDAFLLPGMDLEFDKIAYRNFPVVVLNLNVPSALLGYQVGGIVGHKFLSKYRVGIDLDRSVLRLKSLS